MQTPDIAGASEAIRESTKTDIHRHRKKGMEPVACTIGISISESPDLDVLGFSNLHVQDAMVEITRYLLINDCNLIYGGDLRKGGFTFIFSELAKQYNTAKNYESLRISNYFAWPIHLRLSRMDDSEFKASNIRVQKLPMPPGVSADEKIFIKPDSLDEKKIWAKSLTYMRELVTHDSEARIIIGGQLSGYMGIMPGLVEEAVFAIRRGHPVYLCGAFGGAAKAVIDAIMRGKSLALDEEFQRKNKLYDEFYMYWNKTEPKKINYKEIQKELSDYGPKGLAGANGLSEGENNRLAETKHIPEMIYLILKGLREKGLLGVNKGG